jgi:hypothetical protein
MKSQLKGSWPAAVPMLMLLLPVTAAAVVVGDPGTVHGNTRTYFLTATDGRITMGDGETAYMWGYASLTGTPTCPGGNCMQFPGPTLIVNQGEHIVITLTNHIPTLPGNTPVNTSIVFPGQSVAPGAGAGVQGALTLEARPGETITYSFTASQPGTYSYYSGTQSWLQVEMGLLGALIVRPSNVGGGNCPSFSNPNAPSNGYAYCAKNAYFDREYLFLTSDMDPLLHRQVEFGNLAQVDNTARHPTAWLINGRTFPDTMAQDYAGWLPNQPYGSMPMMHPLESVLMRLIGGGRDLHPFHTHGQNHLVIARDGQLLQSSPTAGVADLPVSDYTTTTVAGETVDAIWGPWTGFELNWDVFGPVSSHACSTTCTAASCPLTTLIAFKGLSGFDPTTGEWCADHNKPIPVKLPADSKMTYGQMYGGTPYLGVPGEIPPIDPNNGAYHSNQNPMAGLSFMWHSHSERELTTNNIFIGGMATMALVLPYSVVIP